MPGHSSRPARVLVIAGSDSGGGAGIQGDIKTVHALGGYATTAVTALTAQNTLGVSAIHAVPPEFVAAQIRAVLEDIGADAVKTGMLLSEAIIAAVEDTLWAYPGIPLVIDPVMLSKSGAHLLLPEAVDALKARLFPRAFLITPNIPEAEMLAGMPIRNVDAMKIAAARLRALGTQGVLIKGGHLPGATIESLLLTAEEETIFSVSRIPGAHTHGTGCALASAIATGIAQGLPLAESIAQAQNFVAAAIARAPELGGGAGPMGFA